MKLFDVRYSGEPGPAPWPDEPPVLRPLSAGRLLRLPGGASPDTPVHPLPAGTRVSRGQPLTTALAEAAPALLAPQDGRVVGSSRATLLNGASVPAVEMEVDPPSDGPAVGEITADASQEQFEAMEPARAEDLALWIDRLRGAGIWADRHASPNLLDQLHQALRRPIDTVLCSMLDSDMSLPLNSALAATMPAPIIAATALLGQLTGARRTWLAAESGAPAAWFSRLRRLARQADVRLVSLRNDYPQSDPTMLLYALLDRRLRPGRLPVEQGVLLLDAAAACSIGRWLLQERPMLDVPLAVFDHGRIAAHFVRAPLGMELSDVLGQLGISTESAVVRGGDMLRDQKLPPGAVVGGAELTVHVSFREPPVNPEPCIRCSWCVEGCPTRIQPAGLLDAAQRQDVALAEYWGLEACIECGICSYVCPSRLPLLDGIRKLRGMGHSG